MSRENVEAVRAAVDAWNRGDREGWLEAGRPDAVWISDIARRIEGSQKVYRGRDAIREYWDEWHDLWRVEIEIEQFRDHGDTVVAIGHIRTRTNASGVDLDSPVAYLARFDDDGLMVEMRSYLDPAEASAAAQPPSS